MTPCQHPGCPRDAVMAGTGNRPNRLLCSRHDGLGEPTACMCETPTPDGLGECSTCHRLVRRAA